MSIIFPAFVSLYKTKNNKTCIYYFRGLFEDGTWVYQLFNEEQMPNHIKEINDDGSILYIFKNNITSIKCHLISNSEQVKNKIINLDIEKS